MDAKATNQEEIARLTERVRQLLKEKNAVMLAHNYQPPEIQDAADMCGDSLELSIKASKTGAQVIVFAGVHFMAETASILSPQKTVILPRENAGCPMADMIDPQALAKRKEELPGVPVVTYVNSPAAVKALTDVCCTSANVVKVINSIEGSEVLMAPDKNLAMFASRQSDKKIHIWEGCCPYHDALTPQDILAAKEKYPNAVVMAHPECRPEVIDMADAALSTSGMLAYPDSSDAEVFIVGTEVGILHPLKKRHPNKIFVPASEKLLCQDMKRITLLDVISSLENMTGVVKVPEEIRIPALSAVEKMTQYVN
ncbi:quinolinate synthetase [Desulfatibacillum alkenivorans DSM 16219]|jgi:quinolinate synthase|uniref:Quinolinate synthase n=1 Tax=Desulfatibacillum alkenivorans DSM 16219 TaxID=1121393 RepID=A0A1M6F8K3_9BACT|nr:quinolinate synthase NadA [Desulfatibacillum alkenivorans]SHI94058.1 quinolinate synthetase [Desulfatibacillum alkenivorans DSM 16219]